jgi:hypothetical protein
MMLMNEKSLVFSVGSLCCIDYSSPLDRRHACWRDDGITDFLLYESEEVPSMSDFLQRRVSVSL